VNGTELIAVSVVVARGYGQCGVKGRRSGKRLPVQEDLMSAYIVVAAAVGVAVVVVSGHALYRGRGRGEVDWSWFGSGTSRTSEQTAKILGQGGWGVALALYYSDKILGV
jgi:hypothetical protein